MRELQPDQANFLLNNLFLPDLKNEHRTTKSVIEAIPPDKGDYRPDTNARGALELAWHIVSTEMRFMEAVSAGQFDLSPRPCPEAIKNSQDLTRWYTENFDAHFEKLTKVSNEQLLKIIDFRGLFQLPAVIYLNFVLHHTIHHRGQLSTYLRPAGSKVPAIYGESYDSAAARKAAQ
ncbi:MAG: DinB family protein [Acidobacteriaceae bacterium]|nr:DinB family protein [Acidobacteriaceae bacterium]MBV9295605.1 DinB family protein [Acidobacteriaceae bacterium]MBV9764716.1 DinB family protein [Acidobacteriaceae bacterium]